MTNPQSPARAVRRFTRREAAARYGVDEKTIRNAEKEGLLRPYSDERGVTRYLASDLASWAAQRKRRRRTRGELEADVFACFEQGKRLHEIVVELQLPSSDVMRLHARWLAMREHADLAQPLEVRRR